jgi:hypothetical protein
VDAGDWQGRPRTAPFPTLLKGFHGGGTPHRAGPTIAGIVGLLLFDFVFHVRKAHAPTWREAAIWSDRVVTMVSSLSPSSTISGSRTESTVWRHSTRSTQQRYTPPPTE